MPFVSNTISLVGLVYLRFSKYTISCFAVHIVKFVILSNYNRSLQPCQQMLLTQ